MSKTFLCVNPWIYDFAAYDFWMKPIGLLRIAGMLRDLGHRVVLLDCLDRFHPLLRRAVENDLPRIKDDTTGKYIREKIPKPDVLDAVPRYYCRYGVPPKLVPVLLPPDLKPDFIFITSLMTYWYPAVRDMADTMRALFPGVPIVLGGVYATLCPDHAKRIVRPDFIYTGQRFDSLITFLSGLLDCHIEPPSNFPRPAYELYPDLRSVAIETSRGCPNKCSFCASKILCREYQRRPVEAVFGEILFWHKNRSIRHFCFYDDALLHQPALHFVPLLQRIVAAEQDIFFHAPNGIQPKLVDRHMAELLFRAGFKTIRLSFESSAPHRQQAMSLKVTNIELERAVDALHRAGFRKQDIGVYVLMGLADQDMTEVENSIKFVRHLGAFASVASFSPIPGTGEWNGAVKAQLWSNDTDLLLSNNSVFPLWSKKYGIQTCLDFMRRMAVKQRQGRCTA